MEVTHDPLMQIKYLREVLIRTHKPIGVFIAAGCSFSVKGEGNEALIPNVAGLTSRVKAAIVDEHLSQELEGVIANFKARKADQSEPNIEDILSIVRTLREIISDQDHLDCLDKLEKSICSEIVSAVKPSLPRDDTPFNHLAKWIGSIDREVAVQIFTTNYDLLIEEALEKEQVPFFDGFSGSRRAFFDLNSIEDHHKLPSNWVRLWKIHGSLNWFINPSPSVESWGSQVFRSFSKEDGDNSRHLIYPSHLKYAQSRRMPYLAMFDRLKAFIETNSSVLLICGYSFSDEHINDVILQATLKNPSCAVFALLYGSCQDYPKAVLLAKKRLNISLLGTKNALIGGQLGFWRKVNENDIHNSGLYISNWEASDENQSLVRSKLGLGDFVVLGNFFQSVVQRNTEGNGN